MMLWPHAIALRVSIRSIDHSAACWYAKPSCSQCGAERDVGELVAQRGLGIDQLGAAPGCDPDHAEVRVRDADRPARRAAAGRRDRGEVGGVAHEVNLDRAGRWQVDQVERDLIELVLGARREPARQRLQAGLGEHGDAPGVGDRLEARRRGDRPAGEGHGGDRHGGDRGAHGRGDPRAERRSGRGRGRAGHG
jgi:hypothetical protein